jgi:L-asparaginase/Glu-tRNA(Gln) amidotransferase subunit D
MRGNRCQKTHSSFYQAFDSVTYPYLANLGVDVDWNEQALLHVTGVYRPRFEVPSHAPLLRLLLFCPKHCTVV